MITLGIDLAVQPEDTAACFINREGGKAEAGIPELDLDDEKLAALIVQADKVGIDVPLGWPDSFVAAIAAHHRGEPWPANSQNDLCYRKTDQFVEQESGKRPLSVSTNLIGVTALRAARLLSNVTDFGQIDRTGRGRLVEAACGTYGRIETRFFLKDQTKRAL